MLSDKYVVFILRFEFSTNVNHSPLKTQTGSGYFLVPNQWCMMASKRKREDDFEYAPSSAKMSKNEDSEYQRNFA